ncbi:hypothetical protein BGZ54_003001 [Gamsiella multidivaricata]|nr:hypothetical protein BGZ54_003001 [Gamsiella multidivaricata]
MEEKARFIASVLVAKEKEEKTFLTYIARQHGIKASTAHDIWNERDNILAIIKGKPPRATKNVLRSRKRTMKAVEDALYECLYLKTLSNKTLETGQIRDKKIVRTAARMSILLCSNATGSDKRKLFVLSKSHPQGLNEETLGLIDADTKCSGYMIHSLQKKLEIIARARAFSSSASDFIDEDEVDEVNDLDIDYEAPQRPREARVVFVLRNRTASTAASIPEEYSLLESNPRKKRLSYTRNLSGPR